MCSKKSFNSKVLLSALSLSKFLNQLLSEQTDLSEEHFSKFQLYVKTKVEGMKFLRDLIETNLDISK